MKTSQLINQIVDAWNQAAEALDLQAMKQVAKMARLARSGRGLSNLVEG